MGKRPPRRGGASEAEPEERPPRRPLRGGAVGRWVANVFRWNLNAISRAPESLGDLGVGIERGTILACFSVCSQFGSKEEDDLIGRDPADGLLEAFQILRIRQTNQIGVSTELCGSVEPASLAAHEQTAHR